MCLGGPDKTDKTPFLAYHEMHLRTSTREMVVVTSAIRRRRMPRRHAFAPFFASRSWTNCHDHNLSLVICTNLSKGPGQISWSAPACPSA